MLDISLTTTHDLAIRSQDGSNQNLPAGKHLLDAASFMIQENGRYCILLMDGRQIEGAVSEIQFIHVEAVTEN